MMKKEEGKGEEREREGEGKRDGENGNVISDRNIPIIPITIIEVLIDTRVDGGRNCLFIEWKERTD